MRPKDITNFNELNLVFEYCSENLMDFISTRGHLISIEQIKYIVYEILNGVRFLHSKGIVHRDLKPLNVLVSKAWEIKICDFG